MVYWAATLAVWEANAGLIIEEILLCYSGMLIEAGLVIRSDLFSTLQQTPFLTKSAEPTAYSQTRLLRTAPSQDLESSNSLLSSTILRIVNRVGSAVGRRH